MPIINKLGISFQLEPNIRCDKCGQWLEQTYLCQNCGMHPLSLREMAKHDCK